MGIVKAFCFSLLPCRFLNNLPQHMKHQSWHIQFIYTLSFFILVLTLIFNFVKYIFIYYKLNFNVYNSLTICNCYEIYTFDIVRATKSRIKFSRSYFYSVWSLQNNVRIVMENCNGCNVYHNLWSILWRKESNFDERQNLEHLIGVVCVCRLHSLRIFHLFKAKKQTYLSVKQINRCKAQV